jgi:hypothetical protein
VQSNFLLVYDVLKRQALTAEELGESDEDYDDDEDLGEEEQNTEEGERNESGSDGNG